jgi:hypothetical protein
MAEVHELITRVGVDRARELLPAADRKIIDTAAAALATESRAMGITYAGFCLTSLPHNMLPDDAVWRRQGHNVRLIVEPGRLPSPGGGDKLYGVPYGSRARMIMLYLQTRALQTNSPEIELGNSMYEWLTRMGISDGGKQYRDVREQANRISACNLTFVWDDDGQKATFAKDTIIKGGITFSDAERDSRQFAFWTETVRLSDTFYKALREHPVPVWEPAIKLIANKSMAIDIYIWLAYRLHVLTRPTPITWAALFQQFGFSYRELKHFKPRFTEALTMAVAVYPEAKLEVTDEGVTLLPSAPPIPERKMLA